MAKSRFFTLAVATALLAVASGAPIECTDEEAAVYGSSGSAMPEKCSTQLYAFQVCDDDCYRAAQGVVKVAPKCLVGKKTAYDEATERLAACESWRAGVNTTFRYMPTNGTGLAECSDDRGDKWVEAYAKPGTPTRTCTRADYATTPCTDDCLKLIEESVTKAPACLREDQGYSYGEHQKEWLLRCLKSRNESAASNAVMYSVVNGDGSFTRVTPPTEAPPGTTVTPSITSAEKTTESPSSTAPTTAADKQPTPTATQSSSAVKVGLPVLTAVAASFAVYAAV